MDIVGTKGVIEGISPERGFLKVEEIGSGKVIEAYQKDYRLDMLNNRVYRA